MSPRGGDLLRHRDFQKLWAGQTVSMLGSQVSQLALPLVAVLVLHVSAFYVALLGTVDLLPFLLFALPAGVWIDRIPRRPVLIVADTGRALALATVPVVAAFGELTIWQLYAVGFVTGTFTVFFDVAYQSYLPSLVGRPHLVEGNAKLELSRSAAQIAGPGLGGVLVGAITAPYAIVVDSVSFAVSALFLGRIRKREPRPEPTAAHEHAGRADGGPALRARRPALARDHAVRLDVQLLHGRRLRAVCRLRRQEPRAHAGGARPRASRSGTSAGCSAPSSCGASAAGSASETRSCSPGSSAARRCCSSRSRRRASRFPFLVTSGVLVALGIVLYNVTAISLIQTLTPDRLLGRANASRRWIVWGTIPLGSLVGGVLSTVIGVRPTLFVGTIGASFCFLFLLAPSLRSIKTLPDQDRRAGAARRRRRARPRGPVRGGLARYADPVPELPEMEAWRRALNDPVSAFPVAKAGPAHIATLKTFDPPLAALEGRRLSGAGRRGKRLLFPTDDGELVLLVHLMTAGRLKMLQAGEAGPKTPAFALGFEGGSKLVLTENARKKRAGVWLLTPEAAEEELAHLGPEALGLDATALAEILRRESHRLHPLLRDQRAIAGIGRAWANEILHTAKLSPYALSTDLSDEEIARLAAAMNEELARGLELRERGADNEHTYRVHNRLGEPCHVCGTPIAQIDFEEHTIYYCPECQTGGRVLKDRDVPAAPSSARQRLCRRATLCGAMPRPQSHRYYGYRCSLVLASHRPSHPGNEHRLAEPS